MWRKHNILKWAAYVLILLGIYVLQTTTLLPAVFGAVPNLLIPFVVFLALYEGEMAGALYGLAAGFLIDAQFYFLTGFHAIIYLILGCAVGLAVLSFYRNNIALYFLFTVLFLLIDSLLIWFFFYYLWGNETSFLLTLTNIGKELIYTVIASIPLYFFMRFMSSRLMREE